MATNKTGLATNERVAGLLKEQRGRELTARALAHQLKLNYSAIVRALGVLEEQGRVTSREAKRTPETTQTVTLWQYAGP